MPARSAATKKDVLRLTCVGKRGCAWALFLLSLFLTSPSIAHAAVFNPHSFTLANGMEVVVVQNRLSPAVAVMVWYKVGAMDDPAGRTGLAHYLEHMMFKGTEAVPAGKFSEQISALGGEENAFTTQDYTAYHEAVAAEHLGLIMQLEADRMKGLTLSSAVEERAVVLSERQERTENSPQGLFREKMAAALYPDHPYGRPVIGWKEDIAGLEPQDIRAFYAQHYRPNNAILAVSGNVEVADVMRLAAGTFGRLEGGAARSPAIVAQVKPPAQLRVERQDARVTQASFIQSHVLSGIAPNSRRSYALDVLAEILSSGEVGLLHKAFVLEARTASAVSASYSAATRGPASFAFAATPSPGADVRALEADLKAYMQKLARKGVSAADVARAKQRMLDSAVFARDKLMAPAQIFGATLAVGQQIADVESWPERVSHVTQADVNHALRALVANKNAVTGILEPARQP